MINHFLPLPPTPSSKASTSLSSPTCSIPPPSLFSPANLYRISNVPTTYGIYWSVASPLSSHSLVSSPASYPFATHDRSLPTPDPTNISSPFVTPSPALLLLPFNAGNAICAIKCTSARRIVG